MNHLNKPENIGQSEWNELLKKYNNNIPDNILEQLENFYPIQYLIGNVDFYNYKIFVNSNVLIPRYETELLVDKIIKKIESKIINPAKIIDLCTGSGAIAISLSRYSNNISAIDVSPAALQVANKNSIYNKANIKFKEQNILKDQIELNHTLIVSNPPYVMLDEEVDISTKYEPQIALFAKNNGLEFYERIIDICKYNKEKNYTIAFEIGATQAKSIKEMILKEFPNAMVEIEKDYNNYDRFIFAYINE